MPYKEKEIEKQYYSISEVAKTFGVNASTIRFWEKEFDVIKPKKNRKGNRMFTLKDMENLRVIYHLVKERGFTLDGARNHMKSNGEQVSNEAEVVARLGKIKAFLLDLKDQL
ncbi:MAG: MerR family transcriptional regulator [Flavobacteriales bacterium]|nr:MerR family transcriptional regulator [Flavobacteriales bacterium]MDG1767663.1 MerR family transcriptional regulator [Flavobacteriales bacterium]